MSAVFSTATISSALRVLGTVTLASLSYRYLLAASVWLLPPLSLARYQRLDNRTGSWALVTGSSAGIGLGFAQELATRGFNVVLLGHKPDELEEAKKSIEKESPDVQVRIVVLDVIKATTEEINAAIDGIADLPLTVLVNNVGGVPMYRESGLLLLHEYTADEVDAALNLNARFMIQVSRGLIPVLARNGPSLMLNISSAAKMGIPYVAAYSGCKGFVVSLSDAMRREAYGTGLPIDILAVVPGDVESQANSVALTPGTPTSRQYAKCALDRSGRAISLGWGWVAPWWMHAFQIGMLGLLPERVLRKTLVQMFEQKKKDYEAVRKED